MTLLTGAPAGRSMPGMHHPIQRHQRRLQELHEARAETIKQMSQAKRAQSDQDPRAVNRYRYLKDYFAATVDEIALESELLQEAINGAKGPQRAQARAGAREASAAALAAVKRRQALAVAIDQAADKLRGALQAYMGCEKEATEPARLAADLALTDNATRLRYKPAMLDAVVPVNGLFRAAAASLICSLLDGYRGQEALLHEAWGLAIRKELRVSFTEAAAYSVKVAGQHVAALGKELDAEEAVVASVSASTTT
jgi:hypothetical protein